jgi:hypothetical protein
MQFLLLALAAYFAYRFIFHFMIPLIIATRLLRKKFNSVEKDAPVTKENRPLNKDEYIDFEEV